MVAIKLGILFLLIYGFAKLFVYLIGGVQVAVVTSQEITKKDLFAVRAARLFLFFAMGFAIFLMFSGAIYWLDKLEFFPIN